MERCFVESSFGEKRITSGAIIRITVFNFEHIRRPKYHLRCHFLKINFAPVVFACFYFYTAFGDHEINCMQFLEKLSRSLSQQLYFSEFELLSGLRSVY